MLSNSSDINLDIEYIKRDNHLDTYIEAIVFFYENNSVESMESIVKSLNKNMIEHITIEAIRDRKVLIESSVNSLF